MPAAALTALVAATRPDLLRAALATATACALTGCDLCARAAVMYRRALEVATARGKVAVDALNPEPASAPTPRPARLGAVQARTAAKPRATLSSSVRTKYQDKNVPPPYPPHSVGGGGLLSSRRVKPPTRAERARALLTRERYRIIAADHNPCRHEPTCQTEDECIGRLVEYARVELAGGQLRERERLRGVAERAPRQLDLSFTRRPRGKRRDE